MLENSNSRKLENGNEPHTPYYTVDPNIVDINLIRGVKNVGPSRITAIEPSSKPISRDSQKRSSVKIIINKNSCLNT